jgi:thiol-disulfide isomerase/thioredoxin
MTIRFAGNDAVINVNRLTLTAIGDTLYVERDRVTEAFAAYPANGDMLGTMQTTVGVRPPHMLMRNEPDVGTMLTTWSFGSMGSPRVTGHAVKQIDGVDMHEITIAGEMTEGFVQVNPQTLLIHRMHVRAIPPGAPVESQMLTTLDFSPVILDSLSPSIAFDPGTRQKVEDWRTLKVNLVGKPAPDFTLTSEDGSSVTLSELKGSIVVLDFWALWCAPRMQVMPELQAFATWIKNENKPVKVFAVNVWEREPPEKIAEHWSTNAFTLPVLLDKEGKTPPDFAFESIPHTVVIDAEGNVASVHAGSKEESLFMRLRRDVDALLAGGRP